MLVDRFLTDDECDTLIRLGQERGYERSMDVGQKNFDGTYESLVTTGRTSSNAWCLDACFDHPVTQTILHKIENLTGIPDANSEFLQMLQYQENQFYEARGCVLHCWMVVWLVAVAFAGLRVCYRVRLISQLRYGNSEQQHHDYFDFHLQRAQGVRIVTVFCKYIQHLGSDNFKEWSSI